MLTLSNFDSKTAPVILQRGLKYFKDGAVEELEETDPGQWQAVVSGTEYYDVEIVLSGKGISSVSCDCPYDGTVCKHVVAVLYAMREQLALDKKLKPAKDRKLGFDDLLLVVDLEELRDFVRQCKKEDRQFGERFMLHFAEKDPNIDVKAKYEGLVRQMVRQHSDRGFMNYRQTFAFSKDVKSVLLTAEKAVAQKRFLEAFTIGRVLCQELMEVIQSCDDSAGNIGGDMAGSIAIFEAIAASPTVSPELLENMYGHFESLLANKIWFEFGDFGYDLLNVAESIAPRVAPERYLRFLDLLIKTHQGKYTNYRQEFFKKTKIRFLQSIGREKEAEALVAENMEIVEVRRGVVNKAIASKDFTRAKQLVKGGIQVANDKQHPGTVRQWEELLLQIARLEKDIETERQLARKFTFDQGGVNEQYYNAWKATYPPSEWPSFIESHIQAVIKAETEKPRKFAWDDLPNALFNKLAPIYILEGQWERLLRLVPENPGKSVLSTIHPHLSARYPAEMLAFYLPMLEEMGDKASNRGEYQNLAEKMKKIAKDIKDSKEAIQKLAKRLIAKYPRRPAMVEELGRLLRK